MQLYQAQIRKHMKKIHLIMPMGGKGSRFEKSGYNMPKPLIPLFDKPFFYWAVESINKYVELEDIIFVVLQEHIDNFEIDKEILKYYPKAIIQVIPEVLNGAVLTCLEGIKAVADDSPILFNDCDHMFLSKEFNNFCQLEMKAPIDGALLTFISDDPKYSFLELNEEQKVIRTVEKVAISNQAICGAYYFKNKDVFAEAVEKYLENCNYQEYFVSGVYNVMAENGKTIIKFETDYHIPFGVPEEYEEAMQSDKFKEM